MLLLLSVSSGKSPEHVIRDGERGPASDRHVFIVPKGHGMHPWMRVSTLVSSLLFSEFQMPSFYGTALCILQSAPYGSVDKGSSIPGLTMIRICGHLALVLGLPVLVQSAP